MNLIKQTGEANTTVKKNRDIKYIAIHYTAGVTSKSGTAKSTAKYFAKDTTKASADFIVDDEYVVQYNPDIKNRYCWHVGGSKYKTNGGSLYKIATSINSIGIEICSSNDTKKVTTPNDEHWSFTDNAIKNTVELVKSLMEEYNIDIDHVIRHYDVTGKPCPGIIGWNADAVNEDKWLDFKNQLITKPDENNNVLDMNTSISLVKDMNAVLETDKTDKSVEEKSEVIEESKVNKLITEPNVEEKPIVVEPKTESKTSSSKAENKGLFEILINIILGLFK